MRSLVLLAGGVLALAAAAAALSAPTGPWGPETPPFNLQVILRDVAGGNGFGHVKFRQPNDDTRIIYLDTWVRDLRSNRTYLLQRQVDLDADGDCADPPLSSWLTLGEGFALPPVDANRAQGKVQRSFLRGVSDSQQFRNYRHDGLHRS